MKEAVPLAKPKEINYNKIMIDVTTSCNLGCPVCYRKKDDRKDISFETLKGLASKYQGKIISLCGGEPTVREDLSEIIELFAKRNSVFLVTNGVKLVDRAYLGDLRKKGLRYISFSFNGFSDEAYKKINGKPLLDLKLKALDNIKRSGIRTILSFLLVKGVNEGQIADTLDYCLKNRDFIKELRIRTMVPIGSYLDNGKCSVSDLLDIVCRETNIKKEDVLREFALKMKVNSFFKREVFVLRSCSLDFHLRRYRKKVVPAGHYLRDNGICIPGFKRIFLPFELLKTYGAMMAIRGFLKDTFQYEKRPWVHSDNTFKIGLRSWPDKYDMDTEENVRCQTGYYLDGRIISFCQANILKEQGDDRPL